MVGDKMGIIIKHTLKNIITKPIRTFVLILCISVTAISAYLMLDMSNSLSSALQNFFTKVVGTSDINVTCGRGLYDENFEGTPEYEAIKVLSKTENLFRREKEFYSYSFVEEATIYSLDLKSSFNMGILNEELDLADDEIAINKTFSQKYGYEKGSIITLHDKYNEPIDYKVVTILEKNNAFISKNNSTAIVNLQAMKNLDAGEEQRIYQMFVDVKDNNRIEEFIDKVEENAPYIECSNLTGNESLKEAVSQITSLFVLIFIISFLLVIFITVSLSNRIICERMSVIGTLRSLGISQKVTTAVLLVENIIYGILGACIGTAVYTAIRYPMLSSFISTGDNSPVVFDKVNISSYIIVFIGSVIMECISPVFSLVKAVNTPIRDIIFANKDTEYVLSNKQTILGMFFVVTGIINYMAGNNNMVILVISLICFILSVAMLMPVILSFTSKVFTKLFTKIKMPVASFASTEISSKKSTVSSSVLCATAVCLSMTIYIFSVSISETLQNTGYKADVMVMGLIQEKYIYSFIEDIDGVTDVDYMYQTTDLVEINGERIDDDFCFLGLPNKEFFDLIPDYPDTLENNEFVMNKKFADKYGLNLGDKIDFTLKANGIFPVNKTLTFSGYVNTSDFDTSMPVIIISRDLYFDVYNDNPYSIFVKCTNPDETLEIIKNHVVDITALFFTDETYQQYVKDNSSSITGILCFLMVLGIALTLIGTSGNQIIGFEGRKREYSVMYSTSMNRKQLKRLIFLENMISTGISIVISIASSTVIINIANKILDTIDMSIEINTGILTYISAGAIFWIILMFTCISPMRALHKMNIASELKYE